MRLRKAHVLVAGMKGTIAEFCKNVVLAGIGSLTLVDDREVIEESLNANFLIARMKVVLWDGVLRRDSCGEIFTDLQNHTYTKKKLDKTIYCQIQYPSYEEAISVPWRTLPKRTAKLYFAMRDLPEVLKLRNQLCQMQSVNVSLLPESLLERLVAGSLEFSPVCTILGGILGQEVIKAISGKGEPLKKKNFLIDAMDGEGIIEDISNHEADS
ncbi:SUMO-activating enzyme subunit 1B-2-like protein [Drosera capensis]